MFVTREQVYDSRDEQYYQLLEQKGYKKSELVRTKLINPAFLGGPRWPDLRQSHVSLINKELGQVIIVSDGLSDPFPQDELEVAELPDDFENTGFGYEVFLEGRFQDINRFIGPEWVYQWEAHLVDYLSQVLANQVQICLISLLNKNNGVMSIEVNKEHISGIPEELLLDGELGVLLMLGEYLPKVKLVTGIVHYVAIKVLSVDQFKTLKECKFSDNGRETLLEKFIKTKEYHLNNGLDHNPCLVE